MSRLILSGIVPPSTPASGKCAVFEDSANKRTYQIDDAGKLLSLVPIVNFSSTAQTPTAATRTYVAGSNIAIPVGKLQIGTQFQWRWHMNKNANGTATSTIDIAVGTAGTTADTARVSFTKPAGTAVADDAWCEVNAICRGPLSASGIFTGTFTMIHNLSATGHATIPCVVVNTISGAFDVTTANLIVGLCITTGTADVITIQQVHAIAWNL